MKFVVVCCIGGVHVFAHKGYQLLCRFNPSIDVLVLDGGWAMGIFIPIDDLKLCIVYKYNKIEQSQVIRICENTIDICRAF